MAGTGEFLKKRAPFYLAGAALLAIFVVPELTKSGLEDHFPELDAGAQAALDALMGYDGPDGDGLTVSQAISNIIEDEYPGERIYDHRDTELEIAVSEIPGSYRITLDFSSYRGGISYDWSVDPGSGSITPNDAASRHVIEIVDFYD